VGAGEYAAGYVPELPAFVRVFDCFDSVLTMHSIVTLAVTIDKAWHLIANHSVPPWSVTMADNGL
jgi:hypothetical protein